MDDYSLNTAIARRFWIVLTHPHFGHENTIATTLEYRSVTVGPDPGHSNPILRISCAAIRNGSATSGGWATPCWSAGTIIPCLRVTLKKHERDPSRNYATRRRLRASLRSPIVAFGFAWQTEANNCPSGPHEDSGEQLSICVPEADESPRPNQIYKHSNVGLRCRPNRSMSAWLHHLHKQNRVA